MTPRRIAAAIAAVLTALVLQASFIGPVAVPLPISLPAVLVACIALVSGPGTGISLGFTAGLLADLGSEHPVGLLALAWLGVGVAAGILGEQLHSTREGAVVAGVLAAIASALGGLVLLVVHQADATLWQVGWRAIPAAVGDGVLAFALLPIVRAMLRTPALRRPPAPSTREWVGTNG
jgi:cell shape-determining protein MreD